jgi:hypothetical protein
MPRVAVAGHGWLFCAVTSTRVRSTEVEWDIIGVHVQVFDMAAPAGAQRITLTDLQRCGAGGNIVGMLADVAAFWEHDSKEVGSANCDVMTVALSPSHEHLQGAILAAALLGYNNVCDVGDGCGSCVCA